MTTTLVRETECERPVAATAKEDRKAFFVIFATAFVVLLAMALVAQTLGLQWRSWLPGAEGVKSVTGGVKAAVYTFMSHLQ
jgi:light-harvesting complex 1 beta chain